MPNIDILIRIESVGGVKDMPSNEKRLEEPVYPDKGRAKTINVPSTDSELIGIQVDEIANVESLSRLEVIEKQNEQIIAASDFILNEISKRMADKTVVVNAETSPDVIESMNYLFGTSGHNGEITFDMYRRLKEFIYELGRQQVYGNIDGAI